jgi:radical SAM protein with 4Fe4S-binding SPASM domain
LCDYWHGRREGELSTDEVFAVLGDLASLGCGKVHFTGGEIFLRRDALALFAEAARLGMRVNLTTNGTQLEKDRIRALVELPVRSVTLSLDSPVAKLHDEVRGREGAFKKTLKALDRLLERRSKKTRVRLNVVVNARTYLSLVELPALLDARPIDGLLLIPMDAKPETGRPGGARRLATLGPTPHTMGPLEIARFEAEVAPVLAARIRVPGFDPHPFGTSTADVGASARGAYARGHYETHRCHVPWHHTLVGPSGDVYPCCMGHRNLPSFGNVRETPLRELWRGEAYRAFRVAMLRERAPICAHCDDFLADNRALDTLHAERATETP